MKTIAVDDEIQKRIKIISALTGIKIYKLMEEAINQLETKYSSQINNGENNRE